MLSGKKPLALLDTCFFQEGWKRAVKEQGWTWCHMMAYSGKAEHFVVVAIPGHEFRLRMLDNVYTRCRAKGQMTDLDHAKIGILLGYTKEQIRAFLVKLSTRQAA